MQHVVYHNNNSHKKAHMILPHLPSSLTARKVTPLASVLGSTLLAMTLITPAAPVEARTLTLAIGDGPTEGFDPVMGWSHTGNPLFQSTLIQRTHDFSYENELIENYQISQDGKTWTITLKPDRLFSDGSPLTSKDVAYTFNAAKASAGKVNMGRFVSAEAPNAQTVVLHLSAPQSTFINVLASLGIVPAGKHGSDYAFHPIGSGPYTLVSYQPGQQMIMEANPHYQGKKNDFDKVVLLFMDEDSAYAAAQTGQLDLVKIPQSLASVPVSGMKLLSHKSADNRGIMFPMVKAGAKDKDGNPIGNDVTADVAIRKAINYAINRQQLADQLLEGHAVPAFSAVYGLPWDAPDVAFKDGDVKKAIDILEQAGWKDTDGDGVREKDGVRAELTLWYTAGDTTRREISQAVREMVKPLGISMNLRSGSWDEVSRYMHANPVLFGWGSLDPSELYNHYHSSKRGVEFFNPGYYSNPAIDKQLDLAMNTPDWKTARSYWQQVNWNGKAGVGIQGDAAWAWLLNLQHTYLANPCLDMGNVPTEPHAYWSVLGNITEWKWTCQ